jgi:hypothetical protein
VSGTRIGLILGVALMAAAGQACSRSSPVGPTAGVAMISGRIYFQDPLGGEPLIADAAIAVTDNDGTLRTATSNAHGFYTLSVQSGIVSITASKPGYEMKTSHFVLVVDTVLNFSLTPSEG